MPKRKTSPTSSGERPTDLPILRHVALYGLTFTYPVQRLFFPVDQYGDPDKALERAGDALHGLSCAGLLTCTQADHPLRFNKNLKYYILTRDGAKRVGAKPSVTKSPGDLNTSLAILWLCTMDEKRFHRVTSDDLRPIFGDRAPHHNISHVISEDGSGPTLYRIYTTDAEAINAVKHLRKNCLASAQACDALRPLIEVGDYGFAILVPTEKTRKAVQKLLSQSKGDELSLNRLARFTVRIAPTPETLADTIKSLQPRKASEHSGAL